MNPTESRTIVQSDVGIAPIMPQMFEPITSAGLLDDKLVRNQPVAAVFESETVRIQPNGTSLTTRVIIRLYRDGEGRTRRERVIISNSDPAFLSSNAVITIYDPVARFSYSLNPSTRTAFRHRLPPPDVGVIDSIPQVVEFARVDNLQTGTVRKYRIEPPRVERLGIREINGVSAEGRRLSFRIPAGALGNSSEIESTHETWIARDLKMLVQSSTKNPVIGEHNFRLTSLSRSQQPSTLFIVPSDYTVQESGTVRTDLPPPF